MAFNPSGTNYASMLESRRRADEGVTASKKRLGQRERAERVRKSGERSDIQKLLSAGTRAGAAYLTGGMSETMGFGGAIDSAMLGTDSEGRAVRNEYGDLVGTGTAVYQGMSAQKDAKLAKQDAKYNALRDKRMQTVQMLFDANMPDRAMAMQSEVEDMDYNYQSKRKGVEDQGLFSRPDYSSITPEQMSPAEREATRKARLQEATGESTADASQAFTGDQTRGGVTQSAGMDMQPETKVETQPQSLSSQVPPQLSAPRAPSQAEIAERALKQKQEMMRDRDAESSLSPEDLLELRQKQRFRG